MSGFVLDASVTLSWFFDDEISAPADDIFALTDTHDLVVPPHWFAEVANGMLMGERRARRGIADTARFVERLEELKIMPDELPPESCFGRVLPLARAHRFTVHDALYLELASRRGLPLATLDGDLAAAARSVGIDVLGAAT